MLKAKDLRNMSLDELKATVMDHRNKLFVLVNEQRKADKREQPHLIRQTRKEIARLMTVITEKELAA